MAAPTLRDLPKIDRLLQDPRLAVLPRDVTLAKAREVIERLRSALLAGEPVVIGDVADQVQHRVEVLLAGRLRPVLNATGVVVHTNLGRSPWPEVAVQAASAVARGYCNLELDLERGVRGGRLDGVSALLAQLTGAEAGLVVNNGAAAVLLCLTALARGREVVVSRGELVEIGGSFRVPDVIASGGALLVEVGTTNRTRPSDYHNAITPQTAMLLKVHPSNFKIVGFTTSVSAASLAEIGGQTGLTVIEDQGSGRMEGEGSVRSSIAAGVDLVVFSGDKLIGGPQAGYIVGRAELVARLQAHALYRALRVGKSTLAASEATLASLVAGESTPVQQMIDIDLGTLRERARALHAALAAHGVTSKVREDVGYVGGGSLAGEALPSVLVALDVDDVEELARRLRTGTVALVARVRDGCLWLDLRTLHEAPPEEVAARVAVALASR